MLRYQKHELEEILFEVKDWFINHPMHRGKRIIDNVRINVKAGEVVGIAGLMVAGRTEFAMNVFGESYGTKVCGKMYIEEIVAANNVD